MIALGARGVLDVRIARGVRGGLGVGAPSPTTLADTPRRRSTERGREVSVCVLEKGSEIGAQNLSGAVIEPNALTELFTEWKESSAPQKTQVGEDKI